MKRELQMLNQKGFTLIEIIAVLVIMTQGAKIK
jgi:prepilin-type N-terminal cleavage/methylation domain-containing protein